MGMDFYIYSGRNHESFKHDEWWNNKDIVERFYTRKPWGWVEECSFFPYDYQGEYIQMNKENLEELIGIACKVRNYWDTYDDVPKLCELRDKFDSLEEQGFHLYVQYG